MGMFDDLVPSGTPAAPAQSKSGMFDDLVPVMDYNRPDDHVRADIAKLEGGKRERALKQWADAFVARERKNGGAGMAADNTFRTLTRGSFIGPFLDELNAGTEKALQVATGGALGSDYDEALAYQRARDRAVDADYPILSTMGQLAGGLAGGIGAARQGGMTVAGLATGGPLATWKPAETLVGNVKQGATVGGIYGGASGFGNAEGGPENRLEGAQTGAGYGIAGGAALPPIISAGMGAAKKIADAASPQIARYSTEFNNFLERAGLGSRRPASLSAAVADGLPPRAISGAEAAADQIIANQLSRANVPVAALRQRVADAEEAARFTGNSRAQQVMAPVDLDYSLQRLAGSVHRQQPEAGNIAKDFITARQTGITQPGRLPNAFGIETREAMARPDRNARPMGQFERIGDALKRALMIQDSKAHGHAPTAYLTEKQILQAAKDEAKDLYSQTYKAGEGVDLRPAINPVLERWMGQLIDEPPAVAAALKRSIDYMSRAVSEAGQKSHIERFDKIKQWMDDQIEKSLTSANGRQRYLGGKLIELKNDLLDSLSPERIGDLGAKYKAARDAFSSRMEARDALNLGASIWKQDSDVVADQFKDLGSHGLQKMFRMGVYGGYRKEAARAKRTADVTQMFENPRIQEILNTVIPATEKGSATFSDRPQRFGRFIANEKEMIGTRNEVLGNSKTAQRSADDAALNTLSDTVEQIRSSPTLTALAIKTAERGLNRLFGFRADTAAFIAHKLFNANPAERERLLAAIEARMGANRTEQLHRLLQEQQKAVLQAGSIAGGSTVNQRRDR